jgi:flagellar biosynthesis protein FlhF
METRTVRAENMLAAMEMIKRDLGPEAIVISVRQVLAAPAWQVWQKPMIEVLAMKPVIDKDPVLPEKKAATPRTEMIYDRKDLISDRVEPSKEQKLECKRSHGKISSKNEEELRLWSVEANVINEKETLEKFQQELRSSLKSTSSKKVFEKNSLSAVVKKYYDLLIKGGVDEQLTQRVSRNCIDTLSKNAYENETRVKEYFKLQLNASLKFYKQKERNPKVICFVGTSGSGKTATCAKLIVKLSNGLEKKITWVSADTIKIGAISEARAYAETIGVALKLAYTPEELSSIVKVAELESNYVIVDTPAFNPFAKESISELGDLLASLPQRNTWLVASASTSGINLASAYASTQSLAPKGLILTKFDETARVGEAVNLAWQSQLPMVYFSIGPRILNDLIPAEANLIVDALFEERFI